MFPKLMLGLTKSSWCRLLCWIHNYWGNSLFLFWREKENRESVLAQHKIWELLQNNYGQKHATLLNIFHLPGKHLIIKPTGKERNPNFKPRGLCLWRWIGSSWHLRPESCTMRHSWQASEGLWEATATLGTKHGSFYAQWVPRSLHTPFTLAKKQKSHKLNRRVALRGTHNYTPMPVRRSHFQCHFHQWTPVPSWRKPCQGLWETCWCQSKHPRRPACLGRAARLSRSSSLELC